MSSVLLQHEEGCGFRGCSRLLTADLQRSYLIILYFRAYCFSHLELHSQLMLQPNIMQEITSSHSSLRTYFGAIILYILYK